MNNRVLNGIFLTGLLSVLTSPSVFALSSRANDTDPPQVTSIVRCDSSGGTVSIAETTTDSTVYFLVTFDEKAFNVDPDDFSLEDTWDSVWDESVSSVEPFSTEQKKFIVCVDRGAQEGQLRLVFNSGSNVVDTANNLGVAAYSSGEQYYVWGGKGLEGIKTVDPSATSPPPKETYRTLNDAISVFNQFGKGTLSLRYQLKAGTYYEADNFTITQSGDVDDPVIFETESGGVIFKFTGSTSSWIFSLIGSWIVLDGFTFDAFTQPVAWIYGSNNQIRNCSIASQSMITVDLVFVDGAADGAVIDGCYFHVIAASNSSSTTTAIKAQGANCEVLNNSFHLDATFAASLQAVSNEGGAAVTFRGNHVSCRNDTTGDDPYAVYLPLGGLFEQNYVHLAPWYNLSGNIIGTPNPTFSGVWMGGAVTARNNIIFNFPKYQFVSSSTSLTFEHNTLYQANTNLSTSAALLYLDKDFVDGVCRNNILFNGANKNLSPDNYGIYDDSANSAKLKSNNNLFWMPNGAHLGFTKGSAVSDLKNWSTSFGEEKSLNMDPLFVSVVGEAEDFHLTSLSPALEAGTYVLGLDIDGDLRDQKYPDIGADEFYDFSPDGGSFSYAPGEAQLPSGGCGALGVEGLLLAFLLGRGRRLFRRL